MQITLGPFFIALRGPTDQAIEQYYERTRALGKQLGGKAYRFPLLVNLWRFNHSNARHLDAKQLGEGLATVVETLLRMEQFGERLFEPALYRLQGELLLQLADPDIKQAEVCLFKAFEVAQKQQARW